MRAVDGMPHGSIRRRAVQLLVEVVAPARDALREEGSGHDHVEGEAQRQVLPARVDDDAEGGASDAAVQAQARVGRQDARQVLAVARLSQTAGAPLVDDVVQPAADEGQRADQQQRIPDVVGVVCRAGQLALRDQQQDADADDVANAVPADVDGPIWTTSMRI